MSIVSLACMAALLPWAKGGLWAEPPSISLDMDRGSEAQATLIVRHDFGSDVKIFVSARFDRPPSATGAQAETSGIASPLVASGQKSTFASGAEFAEALRSQQHDDLSSRRRGVIGESSSPLRIVASLRSSKVPQQIDRARDKPPSQVDVLTARSRRERSLIGGDGLALKDIAFDSFGGDGRVRESEGADGGDVELIEMPPDNASKVKARRTISSTNSMVLEVEDTQELPTIIQELLDDDEILYLEPDVKIQGDAYIPDDYFWSYQWNILEMEAHEAWMIFNGTGKEIVVLVSDTGVDLKHEDLMDRLWVNEAELNGVDGEDDDGNGFVDDAHGFDFHNDDGDPMDDNGHGTHCAGNVAATANNRVGVAGVHWGAKIMPCKCLDALSKGWMSNCVSCLDYGLTMGATILSNSFGTPASMETMRAVIQAAADLNIPFVNSAGNDGRDLDIEKRYMASYKLPNQISVASTGKDGSLSSFSNYGVNGTVHLAAPGEKIASTYKDNAYALMQGTSMATPQVAGVVALMRGLNPNLTPTEIREILEATVDTDAALASKLAWGGTINARKALQVASFMGSWVIPEDPSFAMDVGPDTPLEIPLRILVPDGPLDVTSWSGELVIHASSSDVRHEISIPLNVVMPPPDLPTPDDVERGSLGPLPVEGGGLTGDVTLHATSLHFHATIGAETPAQTLIVTNDGTTDVELRVTVNQSSDSTMIFVNDNSEAAELQAIAPGESGVVQVQCFGLAPSSSDEEPTPILVFKTSTPDPPLFKIPVYCSVADVRLDLADSGLLDDLGVRHLPLSMVVGTSHPEVLGVLGFEVPPSGSRSFGYRSVTSTADPSKLEFEWLDLGQNWDTINLEILSSDAVESAAVESVMSVTLFGTTLHRPLLRISRLGFLEVEERHGETELTYDNPPLRGAIVPVGSPDIRILNGNIRLLATPSRIIVQWSKVTLDGHPENFLTFQLQLEETGAVTFHYENLEGATLLKNLHAGIRGFHGEVHRETPNDAAHLWSDHGRWSLRLFPVSSDFFDVPNAMLEPAWGPPSSSREVAVRNSQMGDATVGVGVAVRRAQGEAPQWHDALLHIEQSSV